MQPSYVVPYQDKKVENAVIFFVLEHYKKTGNVLYKIELYDYLFRLDAESIIETGWPILGLTYRTSEPYMPIPLELWPEEKAIKYRFKISNERGEEDKIIVNKSKPDMDYFSLYESKLMKEIVKGRNTEEIKPSNCVSYSFLDLGL